MLISVSTDSDIGLSEVSGPLILIWCGYALVDHAPFNTGVMMRQLQLQSKICSKICGLCFKAYVWICREDLLLFFSFTSSHEVFSQSPFFSPTLVTNSHANGKSFGEKNIILTLGRGDLNWTYQLSHYLTTNVYTYCLYKIHQTNPLGSDVRVPSADRKRMGFVTFTAASHQGVIETDYTGRALLAFIFISLSMVSLNCPWWAGQHPEWQHRAICVGWVIGR